MRSQLIKLYCETVCSEASKQGFKLQIVPIGHVWIDKDGNQFGSGHHTNDSQDALHAACMFLDQQKLHLGEMEIK